MSGDRALEPDQEDREGERTCEAARNVGEEGKRRHGCFFYGCITVILILLLCIGVAVFTGAKAWRELPAVESVCEEYLNTVEDGDDKAAYSLASDAWQQAQSFEKFSTFIQAMRKALGPCKTRKRTTWRITFTLSGGVAVVVYQAQYEKGPCVITFTVVQRDGKWRVQAANYNSPAIIKAVNAAK
jgi:hypothetical protein